ncbi:MAG TPA: ribosome silencing factor [Ramlibacter sp.]|uniref:ribosome silencing factor n=1 Tax=Ramlibacter sp. TaxID=1917967 RepID=UPI002B8E8B81|nr:ribosome silencing factor [Ramlibacter sp.]HVZ46582.1 ribosome silencing factor [Ramlibacter sp.]
MTQTATVKKDTQRLQRAIVDGLEDVKGQDIQVFNTEHLSPLFERVIVASGTSNRQTKALASSVVESVRDAGFPKPRIEGQENGEWIIVDCGAAVAHIMQPAIRQYYHLEEIWGEKPVRLKLGAPKPAMPAPKPAAKKAAPVSLKRSSAVKTAAKQAQREAAKAKQAAPAKTGAKAGAKTGAKSAAVKAGAKTGAKAGAKSAPRRGAPARKTAAPSGNRPASGARGAAPAARKAAPKRK